MSAVDSPLIIIEDDEERLSGFIECDNKLSTEICFIECIGRYWCQGTTLEIVDSERTANLKEISMICKDAHACSQGVVVDITSTTVERFTLLCYGKFACMDVQMSITTMHFRDVDVKILCDGDGDDEVWSCQSMSVALQVQSGSAVIRCLKTAACESLSVSVDDEAMALALSVEMYQHSEDVHISHPNPDRVDIECSVPSITRFIMFEPESDENSNALSSTELRQLVRQEYTANALPCDGIHTVCTDSTLDARECEMEYVEVLANVQRLEKDVDSGNLQAQCYWLESDMLFVPVLTCDAETCSAAAANSNSVAPLSDVDNLIIVVVAAAVVACSIGVAIYCFCRRRKERIAIAQESLNLKNPMVINIAIAGYEHHPKAPELKGFVPDLDGLEHDLRNSVRLFGEKLQYDCFPQYELEHPKMMWTKSELEQFLEERAAALEQSLQPESPNKYDGLICVISGHGMDQQIITSDYKLVTKLAIHRCFSKQGHALSRMVARIFLFDCCDGDGEHGKYAKGAKQGGNSCSAEKQLAELIGGAGAGAADVVLPDEGHEAGDAGDDTAKAGADDEKVQSEPSVSSEALWAHNTEHPDYQLAELNASTRGFQSKLNTVKGSYVITGFVQRAEQALSAKGYVPRIGPIFKQIQQELGKSLKKQQPSYVWNNNTENVQLFKRGGAVDVDGTEQQKTMTENNGHPALELALSEGMCQ